MVQNGIAIGDLQRGYETRRVGHGDGLAELGARIGGQLDGDESAADEQRVRYLDREREPGAELRGAAGSAGRGAAARAVELGGHGRDERDERAVRGVRVPRWHVQHELPGSRVECWQQQRELQQLNRKPKEKKREQVRKGKCRIAARLHAT